MTHLSLFLHRYYTRGVNGTFTFNDFWNLPAAGLAIQNPMIYLFYYKKNDVIRSIPLADEEEKIPEMPEEDQSLDSIKGYTSTGTIYESD